MLTKTEYAFLFLVTEDTLKFRGNVKTTELLLLEWVVLHLSMWLVLYVLERPKRQSVDIVEGKTGFRSKSMKPRAAS